MLVIENESSTNANPEFEELESQIIKLIDRIQITLDIEGKNFQLFERNILYPFLKLLIKKFLSYYILKKLEDIANQCEMRITSDKISGSLKALEKKLFKNNKLYENKQVNKMEELDVDAEIKKQFGFDINAFQNMSTPSKNIKYCLFGKKKSNNKGTEPNKHTKKIENRVKNDISNQNRCNLFYNKFIRKKNKSGMDRKAKKPIQMINNKNLIRSNKIFGNVRMNSLSKNEVPDFYKLNKMISKNNENIMDFTENKYKTKLENYKKEQLKNRKLPKMARKKNTKRKLITSFNYTKHIKQKKCLGDMNDENIINLQSRADILHGYEKEMINDLNDSKTLNEDELISTQKKDPNKMIGVMSDDKKHLFVNMNRKSETESISKLGPRFDSFAIKNDKEGGHFNNEAQDKPPVDSDEKAIAPNQLENKFYSFDNIKNDNKKIKKNIFENNQENDDQSVYEICSDDWENNIFGKHTPTKDFLKAEVAQDINS